MESNPLYYFEEFNEEIFAVYERESLLTLSKVMVGEKRLASTMYDTVMKKVNIHPLPYSMFKLEDEMNFITKDVKYITGVLFYLRPFIIDTEESGGRYNQNLADRRFLMYANFGLQSIYNFWDRIGDLLHLYFETGLDINSVYFGRVLNNIKPIHKTSPSYIELNDIYNNELSAFLGERHTAVHHYQLEAQYYWAALENRTNDIERAKFNDAKHALPEKFRHHLNLCFKGYELAERLISTLPDKPETPATPAQ